MKRYLFFTIILYNFMLTTTYADTLQVNMLSTHSKATELGTVELKDTQNGLLITPHLADLPPGMHGFHIHQQPNCNNHGMDAGGHYDPTQTNTHQGPYQNGHLGDLPALYVNKRGEATIPTLAPHLKTKAINKRALIIHAGSDTYRDTPHLGGGGERIACGLIP